MITNDLLVAAARLSLQKWERVQRENADPERKCGFCGIFHKSEGGEGCELCPPLLICRENIAYWARCSVELDRYSNEESRALIAKNIEWCQNFIDNRGPEL